MVSHVADSMLLTCTHSYPDFLKPNCVGRGEPLMCQSRGNRDKTRMHYSNSWIQRIEIRTCINLYCVIYVLLCISARVLHVSDKSYCCHALSSGLFSTGRLHLAKCRLQTRGQVVYMFWSSRGLFATRTGYDFLRCIIIADYRHVYIISCIQWLIVLIKISFCIYVCKGSNTISVD